jgi:hypothetical protein
MATITKAKALEILRSKPSSFVSFETQTKATLFNKGKGENAMIEVVDIDSTRILKHSKFVGLIGTKVEYEKLVNGKGNKEADLKGAIFEGFSAKPRKWGSRVDGVLVEHEKDGVAKQYVTIHCVSNNKPHVSYSYKGKPFDATDEKYDTWRKKKSAPKTQLEAGIEATITYTDYDLDSIVSIKVGGETYNIAQ